MRGGGKWGVGKRSFSHRNDLLFVFLLYEAFADLDSTPKVWIMPAPEVEERKRQWLDGGYAIYYSHKLHRPIDLDDFRDRWDYVG